MPPPAARSPLARRWSLDPEVAFLNHGSFGACPVAVLARQAELRARMEREPVRFMVRELEPLLDESRAELAAFLGARPEDTVFVPNATAGVNAVLRSLEFRPGDELLTTDHEYNACRNALGFAAERSGARVVAAAIPVPVRGEGEIADAILSRVTPRTRLAMISHVTSPTAIIFPIERLVRELAGRGVDTLVDAAHSPGMVPLNLDALGAAYTTGNCHKWICAPKGAGFLHVRRDRQRLVRPLVISHGANSTRTDRSRLLLEFDWPGTQDFTPWLCVGEAIRVMGAMADGGWPEIMRSNREKAAAGRASIIAALARAGVESHAAAPDAMTGSIASFTIPPMREIVPHGDLDPLKHALERRGFQVPVVVWPSPPSRLVRISAQLYNTAAEYERLGGTLAQELAPWR